MWRWSLIALVSGAIAAAEPSGARSTPASNVAEIPAPEPVHFSRSFGARLRRTHDLLRLFAEGAGDWHSGTSGSASLIGRPLPWVVAAGRENAVRLATWPGVDTANDDEGMLAIVLRDGERWCTPELDPLPGSRLRFEAVRAAGTPVLTLSLPGRAAAPVKLSPSAPGALTFESQTDLPLAPVRGSLCMESRGGVTQLGEPRVLAPAAGREDSPPWVVILVLDNVRGDVLSTGQAERLQPALRQLAASARVYRRAVSVGSHTLAAMAAIQTGRDPLSIDPASTLDLKSGTQVPRASEQVVFARPNLYISQRLQDAGYHSILFGHNAYLSGTSAFARYSLQGNPVTGTVDNVRRLAPLFSRYADERIALLFWLSAAHTRSSAPRRLYDAFGCGALQGLAERRCRYDASLRHLDEAVGAFEAALSRAGLQDGTLQVVVADHGEQFHDGTPYERFVGGTRGWVRLDDAHGNTTDWTALHVPLLLKGPGIPAGVWDGRVSNLDVVPTLQALLGLPRVARLDGTPLPLDSHSVGREHRRLVSYGFCSHSDDDGRERLVWWDAACGPRRSAGSHEPAVHNSELWHGRELVSTDLAPSARLKAAKAAHARWILDHLPEDVLILDCAGIGLGRASVSVRLPAGRIVDWGPSSTVRGFDRILSARLTGESRLDLQLQGFKGRYLIMTRPSRAGVILTVRMASAATTPVVFVGPRQLPLEVEDRLMDPAALPALFVASGVPALRSTDRPCLRLWWQRLASPAGTADEDAGVANIERVLRAWGYIR